MLTYPRSDRVERVSQHGRYWTRRGARWAADAYLVSSVPWHPELRKHLSVEVAQLPPPVDVYADRYWQGDEYVGPEP